MTPDYSPSVNEYNVTVPKDVTKLDLTATPYDKNAKVSISGNKELVDGQNNVITLKVTAEDGTVRTIKLNVTKSQEESNAELLDIKVKNHTMTPTFSPEITSYSVDVDSKTNSLYLTVKAPAGVTYEVNGNEDFQAGKNIVSIKVTDKAGYDKYYQIVVNKDKSVGSTFLSFIPFLIVLGLLFLILLLLFLLMLRKKRNQEVVEYEEVAEGDTKQNQPISIDFKPEFNFNSKKDTDDDILYANGNLTNTMDLKKQIAKPEEQKVVEAQVSEPEAPKASKEDLYDAMREAFGKEALTKELMSNSIIT